MRIRIPREGSMWFVPLVLAVAATRTKIVGNYRFLILVTWKL
jgi:hypothetical protein